MNRMMHALALPRWTATAGLFADKTCPWNNCGRPRPNKPREPARRNSRRPMGARSRWWEQADEIMLVFLAALPQVGPRTRRVPEWRDPVEVSPTLQERQYATTPPYPTTNRERPRSE